MCVRVSVHFYPMYARYVLHLEKKKQRFSVNNLMIGIQLADIFTRCSSHRWGKSEARWQTTTENAVTT